MSATPIEQAKKPDGTIDPEKLKQLWDEACAKNSMLSHDWTECRRCGQRHRGLKFATWARGEALRCPPCSGVLRDLTEAEVKAIEDEERRRKLDAKEGDPS